MVEALPDVPLSADGDALEARTLVERLLPEPDIRMAVLRFFASAIQVAHPIGEARWGLTLRPGPLSLNIGRCRVVALSADGVWIAFDESAIAESDEDLVKTAAEWRHDAFRSAPQALAGNLPAEKLVEIGPALEQPFRRFVEESAAQTKRTPYWKSHSQGAVQYLEQALAITLPQPAYDTAAVRGESSFTLDTFSKLFDEFLTAFWRTAKGRRHAELYASARREAAESLATATRASEAGADLTDLVLTGFLPHRDTEGNRTRGGWIHVAPAITKDARMFFEGAGWVRSDDWPVVSRRIYEFVRNCAEDPAALDEECRTLAVFTQAKGFQAGMLSPILNALRPDAFLITNAKSLKLINAWFGTTLGSSIRDYPRANEAALEMLRAASPVLETAHEREAPACDLLDAFSHWLSAEKKWWRAEGAADDRDAREDVEHWKISPGERAEYWEEWKAGGYVAIGWTELGDLSGISRDEFDRRVGEAVATHPDWTASGLEQVWRFAQIPEGAFVVANKGTTAVVGIGRVSGPYVFTPDVPYGHRLPVEWTDMEPKSVNRPGWRKTLTRLKPDEFEAISTSMATSSAADPPLFSQRSFELLRALEKEPRAELYNAHKEDFQRSVEAPVQQLLRSVVTTLPDEATNILETRQRLFGKITKNDWGRGGAWPFCWGALYPKGGERTKEIQLFVTLRPSGLTYGMSFGSHTTNRWGPLVAGLKDLTSDRLVTVERAVHAAGLKFRELALDNEGEEVSFEVWRGLTDGGELKAFLPSAELVSRSSSEVIRIVRDAFVTLLPFIHLSLGVAPETPSSPPALTPTTQGVPVSHPLYTLDTLEEEAGFGRSNLETWLRILRTKRQVILQGPPGTGKTFLAQRLARVLVSETRGLSETVQFHPAYAYEDFIQGIRPDVKEGGLTYRLEPGRFLDFCGRATRADGAPCVLIIDEINRANLARVFGELMYLFEYRDGAIPLAAGGQTFRVPENVFLIGTMNTADRSIARMDYALRRRFAFIRLRPEYGVLSRRLAGAGLPATALVKVLLAINHAIDDPNFELGISYFLRSGNSPTQIRDIRDIWECEIEPYLEEYFYDRPKQVDAWRWSRLLEGDLREWA